MTSRKERTEWTIDRIAWFPEERELHFYTFAAGFRTPGNYKALSESPLENIEQIRISKEVDPRSIFLDPSKEEINFYHCTMEYYREQDYVVIRP